MLLKTLLLFSLSSVINRGSKRPFPCCLLKPVLLGGPSSFCSKARLCHAFGVKRPSHVVSVAWTLARRPRYACKGAVKYLGIKPLMSRWSSLEGVWTLTIFLLYVKFLFFFFFKRHCRGALFCKFWGEKSQICGEEAHNVICYSWMKSKQPP